MNHPWAIFLRAYLGVRIQRARTAPTRGASAVEWVIITAIIAGLATLIKTVVEQKQGEIQNTLGGGNSGS
ncbi:hypothetical protein [Microbispora sp. NBRC 16548]|uniref:hypothetical protein n=1 Tax=Microbispora sp. NBRC 16548 TaxID=3030994 RepID=UPI0024A0A0A3|nr:hypothetical protein [Microbispora sp. NBRC 16548]GLX11574.1 hypothetical protein Misp03_85000 [Microbispora sp. NBRC 16548]